MPTPAFPDRPRADALDKVRGAAAYAADLRFPGLLHAMTVPAPVARGQVLALETEAALRVPGVRRILTPADFPAAPQGPDLPGSPRPGLLPQIAFRGEPLALVVADTLEAAIEGAEAVRARIAPAPFAALMDSAGAAREPAEDVTAGDADAALAGAATIVEASYDSPAQHHNPIELLSTTAVWAEGRLLIHEGSQNAGAIKVAVARTLGLDPAIIDVKSPTVGGAFGQKGWVQRQTALVARAAILTGRPVKLVMPRGQIFHLATFRPHSRHRIRLGADAAGRMVGVHYAVEQQNSRRGGFPAGQYHEGAMRLYGIANYHGSAANLRIDTQAPGHMRAPYEHPACFAFEGAVDELSYRLGRDPVEFRMAHDTRIDVHNGRPLSSRFLNDCLRLGAERFGWARRSAAPGSMTAPDGTQIGWGVACGLYPTLIHPAVATLRIRADGSTRFAVAGHEFGQGLRTALAAVLTRELGVDDRRLEVLIGDTTAAPQHLTAGSWGSASALPLVVQAVARMRAAVAELLDGRRIPGTLHQQIAAVRRPYLEVEVSQARPGPGCLGARPHARRRLCRHRPGLSGLHDDELRRAFRGGAGRAGHAAGAGAAGGQHRRLRPRHQPAHGGEPAARRRRLGHQPRAARGDGDRSAPWRIPQQRPGGIRHRGECRYRRDRCGFRRRAGSAVQQPRPEVAGRGRHGRRLGGGGECGVPRHGPAHPQAADPDRGSAVGRRRRAAPARSAAAPEGPASAPALRHRARAAPGAGRCLPRRAAAPALPDRRPGGLAPYRRIVNRVH
ncbi:xanthine dehydrogenase YagR molybdenum-binding subunit [Pseudoroseomonas cervicalis]|nr:xanthine dehydrogenase YagR molybdenum-binding subunit [Pseudoroseomonas cervicalis]